MSKQERREAVESVISPFQTHEPECAVSEWSIHSDMMSPQPPCECGAIERMRDTICAIFEPEIAQMRGLLEKVFDDACRIDPDEGSDLQERWDKTVEAIDDYLDKS